MPYERVWIESLGMYKIIGEADDQLGALLGDGVTQVSFSAKSGQIYAGTLENPWGGLVISPIYEGQVITGQPEDYAAEKVGYVPGPVSTEVITWEENEIRAAEITKVALEQGQAVADLRQAVAETAAITKTTPSTSLAAGKDGDILLLGIASLFALGFARKGKRAVKRARRG